MPGVELFWFGPADFSASAGHRGQWEGPGVAEEIVRLKDVLRTAGKHCGLMATDRRDVQRRLKEDFRAIGLGMDAGLLIRSLRTSLAAVGRDRVMAAFRSGKVRILVATDVVGRGIDVSGISHIYNYDIPQFCDDYVHRVGRTGRMGREGVAYTLVTPEEGNELTRIEMRINKVLTKYEIPGFRSVESAPAAAIPGSAPAPPPNRYIQSFAAPPAAPPAQTPPKPKPKKYRRAL